MNVIITWWIIIMAWFFVSMYRTERRRRHHEYAARSPLPQLEEGDSSFHGHQAGVSRKQQHEILTRRFPYYAALSPVLQQRFLERLNIFMNAKIFIVKSKEVFFEMPVLVSASAIQLTFGMNDFLLGFYRYIRIFPEEYFAHHRFAFLAGNVQGRTITVAWNQYLKGVENKADGSNVGLHEMAHALYFQKMIIDELFAKNFSGRYNRVISECKEALELEVTGRKDLYSDYANSSDQEFWAESVELFFEKPLALQQEYPSVYGSLKELLNQDPLIADHPLLSTRNYFFEKMNQFTTQLRQRSLNSLPSSEN